MTMVISRSTRLLVTGALAGLLLAGCASGPGQAGSAAIVNGNAISLDSVQAELNNYLSSPAATAQQQQTSPADEARAIVGFAVLDQIDNAAVAHYHLNVPPQAVTEFASAGGGVDKIAQHFGFSTREAQMILKDEVTQLVYANQYVGKFQVTFDELTMRDQKTATDLARKLADDPANARSIMTTTASAVGSQPEFGGKLTGGQIIAQQNQANQQAQEQGGGSAGTLLPLFAAKSNTVLTFPLDQSDWAVLVVHDANTNATPSASDKEAISTSDQQVLYQSGSYLLTSFAKGMSIKISPRYGVWDGISMSVVPTAGAAGSEFPFRTTPSAS